MPDPNPELQSAPPANSFPAAPGAYRPWGMDENAFCTLLHLSPLVPGVSVILTLVMWLTQKDQSPAVDAHGRATMNWLLSAMIYFFVSFILVFVIIGIFTMLATAICSLVFMIIGAVKASKGEVWDYPLSIPFFGRASLIEVRGGPALPPADDFDPGTPEQRPGEGF